MGMRRSALGRKALTVLVSASMVVSMMPTAALADAAGVADASTTEQSQVEESGSGGGDSEKVADSDSVDSGTSEGAANGQATTEQGSSAQTSDDSQQGVDPQDSAAVDVAEVNGTSYPSLQAAIDAATRNATVKLLADTYENVTISTPYVTLDLNGYTLNGGTEKGKPALTVTARVTVKDGSEAQTGTIKREDTAENSGVSSHYVIDIQGSGWLTFESGNVTNNSGNAAGKGASLVRVGDDSVAKYPGLNIKGGTFTQNKFIVIKVDSGDLFLNGGTLNCTDSYAIEDWHRATIKGGTVNGAVAAWTYSGGHNSDLTISGGTVNGKVESVTYDGAEGKTAKVSITGGTVNGSLSAKKYNSTETIDPTKATIEVTGGTFSTDPSRYLIESSSVTQNADGTYGVAKAYLAQVGENSYYTMDKAFEAQTTSGEAITLLRDYTTGSPFNSGTVARVVDLNGHTWTCTGTDANSAAFEINNPNASLTVKNGKVVSSQLIGLIPSAMGGTIKYDNSTLTLEGVEATTSATSGIETNGNNTNDTVVLKNSTLNVPNGFGIYFPSSGTLTIDSSTINAKTMGVQVCSGSLNVNAGSAITVSGDPVEKLEGDGAIQDGAAISVVNRPGYKGLGQIAITGGTFTAKADNAALKAYTWDSSTKQESAFDNTAKKVTVSGGSFSSAVSSDLCAEGFAPVKNEDGTYDVKEGADGYVEDENGNVTISTAAGLFYFAKKVNAGNNFAGKTVTLANDIDLNNEKWTPIGVYSTKATWFKGTFDGQNHAVTGLKVEESKKSGVGFFGKVYTGTIKNLTVEGSVSTSSSTYVGGIVGHGYATITNCTFKGSVGSTDNTMQVGGIAGSGGFTVTNCSVYADVTAECWAGGIVGNCQDGGAYTNCYVEGVVSAKRTYWGGGAAGITPVPLYPSQVISGCYSNTVVKVAGKEVNCPIIAAYNNPLDYNGYSGDLKIYDNSWNKQKNSNDNYPIYAEKNGEGGVLMEGMTAARDNSLIMLEDDLNYVTGDLSKVRIMAGSSVTQAQIDALAVASVGDSKYQSLTEAIDAAQDGQTVTLLGDATENVTIEASKRVTLDLNGHTLNGGTGTAEAAILNKGTVTITDTSAGKTGTIKRDDQGVEGETSYYVIDNNGTMVIDQANVVNNSGIVNDSGIVTGGSSLIRNGGVDNVSSLTINGGTFDQQNFIAVKNDSNGELAINGGTLTSKQSVVQNWNKAQILGGNLTGIIWTDSWTEAGTVGETVIGGDAHFTGRIYMDVTSPNPSTLKIEGGSLDVTKWTVTSAAAEVNSSIAVSGGTFTTEVPADYCAENFAPAKTTDASGNVTYGVASGLVNFWGGSLRMDKYENAGGTFDTDEADLRFGFNFDLPEGATRKAFGFDWGTNKSKLNRHVSGVNVRDAKTQPLKTDPKGVSGKISNLVVTNIPKGDFDTVIYAQMWVTYELNGVSYTIHTDVQSRSVSEIATKIKAAGDDGKISKESKEYKYASALLS